MEEHIKLLQKEIDVLKTNLRRAVVRPGVTHGEILALEKKLSIKIDLLQMAKDRQREGK